MTLMFSWFTPMITVFEWFLGAVVPVRGSKPLHQIGFARIFDLVLTAKGWGPIHELLVPQEWSDTITSYSTKWLSAGRRLAGNAVFCAPLARAMQSPRAAPQSYNYIADVPARADDVPPSDDDPEDYEHAELEQRQDPPDTTMPPSAFHRIEDRYFSDFGNDRNGQRRPDPRDTRDRRDNGRPAARPQERPQESRDRDREQPRSSPRRDSYNDRAGNMNDRNVSAFRPSREVITDRRYPAARSERTPYHPGPTVLARPNGKLSHMPCDSFVLRGSCNKPKDTCAYSHQPDIIRRERRRLLDSFHSGNDAFSAFTHCNHIADDLAARVEDMYYGSDVLEERPEQEHDDDFDEPP
jgi:hypothetical protein